MKESKMTISKLLVPIAKKISIPKAIKDNAINEVIIIDGLVITKKITETDNINNLLGNEVVGKNKKCVYVFAINEPEDVSKIYSIYKDEKEKKKKEEEKEEEKEEDKTKAFSYLKVKCDSSTKYLYVGKVTNTTIRQRIREHFGFGHYKTGALRLKEWMKDSFKFELTIYIFHKDADKAIVNAAEKILIAHYKPLIGKD